MKLEIVELEHGVRAVLTMTTVRDDGYRRPSWYAQLLVPNATVGARLIEPLGVHDGSRDGALELARSWAADLKTNA